MNERDAKVGQSRLAYAMVLLLLQFLLSLALIAWMTLHRMSSAGCSQLCDYDNLALAINSFYVTVLVVFVLSIAALLLLRNHGWWVIAPLVISIVVITAAWLILGDMANRAMMLY